MSITTFVNPQTPRKLNEVRITRFGVYGEWTYTNASESQAHRGNLTREEVVAVVEHVIQKYKLPADHQVCIEYANFQLFHTVMQEADYDRLLYSVMSVTTVVNLCDAPAARNETPVVTESKVLH